MSDQGPQTTGQPQPPAPPPASPPGGPGYDLAEIEAANFKGRSGLSPGAAALGGLALGAAIAGVAVFVFNQPAPLEPVVVASASADPEPEPSASASAEAPSPLGTLGPVALGDPDALKALAERDRTSRAAEETLALARGRAAAQRKEISELKRKIELVPKVAREKSTLDKLRDFAGDRALAIDVLEMLATLEGEVGPDLLYTLWRDRRIRDTETRDLAEELLYSKDVRAKASAALGVTLDLRAVEDEKCDEAAKILERAKTQGDKRALYAMGRFYQKRGCGENKLLDCWPCLREGDLLKDAAAEVRKRPSP